MQRSLCNFVENVWDLDKFVMCILVSRDCLPFCKYIKCHVYPGNHGTHDKLNQIQKCWDQMQLEWKKVFDKITLSIHLSFISIYIIFLPKLCSTLILLYYYTTKLYTFISICRSIIIYIQIGYCFCKQVPIY